MTDNERIMFNEAFFTERLRKKHDNVIAGVTTDFKPRLSEPWLTPDLMERHEKALADAIAKHHIACEELTERQIAEVMKQALACGDIQKLVVTMPAGTLKQGVVYIPFARQQELESEIARLRDILDKAGIEHRKAWIE